MSERLPDALALDRSAALQASAVAMAVLLALVGLQGAVTAAFTSGQQPMVAVDSVPRQPQATAWEEAPSRTVSLQKQQMAIPFGGGTTDELSVRAVTNESHVAFRLSWADPTNDTSIGAPGNYSDAAAIMLHSGSTPPITMGATGTPVNIWYWRSSWEFGEKTAPWSGDMYAYPHPNNETMPGRAAGNPLSKGEYDQFAHNYYARGYGSLSHAPAQPVHAAATRTDEGWSVTFVRERGTDGTHDAMFNTTKPMYLAFAVWNGSADEVNGQKSLTMTYTELNLENGTLAAADSGGSGSSSPSSTPAESGSRGLGGWLSIVVGATLLTWFVAYRRAAK